MKKLLKIFCVTLFSVSAFVGEGLAASKMVQEYQANNLKQWSDAYWKTCKEFDVADDVPCIGDSKNNCADKSLQNPQFTDEYADEYGILMMVARETSVGGAKFCPTMILGQNKKDSDSWTEYYDAGTDIDCVWLCRDGYTGTDCTQGISGDNSSTCEKTELLQSNYDSIHVVDPSAVGSVSIKNRIPNWGADKYENCGKKQGHDLIFAISGWLPGGHGAKVRPYIIRAKQEWDDNVRLGKDYGDNVSWIVVYPAASVKDDDSSKTNPVLGCLNGFRPNADKTDCVPIDASVCDIEVWCSGWDEDNFDSSKHEKFIDSTGCTQWRCKGRNKHLTTAGASQCVENDTSPNVGVDPETGTEVHCEDNQMYVDGECVNTRPLSKNWLMYGQRQTGSDALENQCWTKYGTEYRDCVLP